MGVEQHLREQIMSNWIDMSVFDFQKFLRMGILWEFERKRVTIHFLSSFILQAIFFTLVSKGKLVLMRTGRKDKKSLVQN